jgi:protein TonB
MHAARSAFRTASFVALLMVVHTTFAAAQGFAPTPPPARAVRTPSPASVFVGLWHSESDPSNTISINGHGSSTVIVVTQDHFEAAGFMTGNEAVLLTRTPRWSGAANAVYETGVLRLERLDPATLRARFFADLHGAATREETWKLNAAPPFRTTAAPGIKIPQPDELPAFGQYVYVEELPEAITKVSPSYPDGAREHGIEGQVLVQALVGPDGFVKDTRVVKSIPELDAAAVDCVKQWRFKPALSKGQPVAVWVAVPIKFSLH